MFLCLLHFGDEPLHFVQWQQAISAFMVAYKKMLWYLNVSCSGWVIIVPLRFRSRWPSACSTWTPPCPPWRTRMTRRARARAGSWRRRWGRRSLTSWTKWRPWAKEAKWRRGPRQRWPRWAERTPSCKNWHRSHLKRSWGGRVTSQRFSTNIYYVDATYTHRFGYELLPNGLLAWINYKLLCPNIDRDEE